MNQTCTFKAVLKWPSLSALKTAAKAIAVGALVPGTSPLNPSFADDSAGKQAGQRLAPILSAAPPKISTAPVHSGLLPSTTAHHSTPTYVPVPRTPGDNPRINPKGDPDVRRGANEHCASHRGGVCG